MGLKIVALDGAIAEGGDLSWDAFRRLGDLTVYSHTPQDLVVERAEGAFAVIVNKVRLTAEILSQLPALKYIGIIATGYDNVDLTAASELGIAVCNVPAYSTESVAQMVFALMLEAANHVAAFNREVKDGKWIAIPFVEAASDPALRLKQLSGATLAIYGLGNIGMRVAEIGYAFGMRIISPTSRSRESLPQWIEKIDSTDEMFRRADFLSLNAPLTRDNYHIVNSQTLAMMKPTAVIINTARGGLIDQDALNNALENKHLAMACLDVLEHEPPAISLPLLQNPRCIITPHVAWETPESRARLMEECVCNLESFIYGKARNLLN